MPERILVAGPTSPSAAAMAVPPCPEGVDRVGAKGRRAWVEVQANDAQHAGHGFRRHILRYDVHLGRQVGDDGGEAWSSTDGFPAMGRAMSTTALNATWYRLVALMLLRFVYAAAIRGRRASAKRLLDLARPPAADLDEISDAVDELLDRSVGAEECVIRAAAEGSEPDALIDLSQIDFDALAAGFAGRKRAETERLAALLKQTAVGAVPGTRPASTWWSGSRS